MTSNKIIEAAEAFVKETLEQAEGGHDWWHIHRVRLLALKIGQSEGANLFVVELAALLHDIADHKFHNNNEDIGPAKALAFLTAQKCESHVIDHVIKIIENISFKGGNKISKINTIEFKVVQDADRLDAIGAIGIARAFNYGGYKNRTLYDPDIPPILNMDKKTYMNNKGPTINHFYEKLLLLKDRMHTQEGKKIAEERHTFMQQFLNQFYKEWEYG